MAEKTFKQLEAEIAERGYKALIFEGVEELQNLTRMLSYLLDEKPELQQEIDAITGRAIRLGITLSQFAEIKTFE